MQGVGDLNGDHLGDLAIGSEGSVSVFYGRTDRHIGSAALILYSTDPGGGDPQGAFGTTLGAPGDLNGDGYADLIVGAANDGPSSDPSIPGGEGTGRVYLYMGQPSGVSMAPQEIHGISAPLFGISAACAGDVTGDGYEDLVVGSFFIHGRYPGYVSLFHGGPTGVFSVPEEQMGPDMGDFGACVASIWSLDISIHHQSLMGRSERDHHTTFSRSFAVRGGRS